jgi:methylglutaconyl-CoA hydratase
MTSSLLSSLDDGVLSLTLNRPAKRNALNEDLIDSLHDALAQADLDDLLASADRPLTENAAAALRLGGLFSRLRELPKPILAVVHGRALAGGAGLATACDLVLAGAGSQFGYPEIQRGFAPAMVMALLRRLVGEKVALDLVLTGRICTADEARTAGLVTRVVPDPELELESMALADILAGLSASAVGLTKRLFYQLDGLPLAEGIALGARVNAVARGTPDFRETIAGFLRR